MIVNPQNLRGIYVGFNTLFNKALTTVEPLYKQIATRRPRTPRPTPGSGTSPE